MIGISTLRNVCIFSFITLRSIFVDLRTTFRLFPTSWLFNGNAIIPKTNHSLEQHFEGLILAAI